MKKTKMTTVTKKWPVILILLILWFGINAQASPRKDALIGVKVYEAKGSYAELFGTWRRLGFNALFISSQLAAQEEFMRLARENRMRTFIISPVFYNPEELQRNPGLWAITGRGERAKNDWVEFVCPTRREYREKRIGEICDWLVRYRPDGISLDFIRFFAFWEMVTPDTRIDPLAHACFCPNCLAEFQKVLGLPYPPALTSTAEKADWILLHHPARWIDWKCGVIADVAREAAVRLRRIRPDVLINLHIVPWRRGDFGAAIRTVVAQDIGRLESSADYFSPMCYWHMVKRPPAWVHDVVSELAGQTAKPIVPSIQVKEDYIPDVLAPADFGAALKAALEPPSAGVIFWNWETLAASREKQKLVLLRRR